MNTEDANAISCWLKEMAQRQEAGVLEIPQGFLRIRPIMNWTGIEEVNGRDEYVWDFCGYEVRLSHDIIIRKEIDINKVVDKTLKYLNSL